MNRGQERWIAVRKSNDCCRQSDAQLLWAGVSDSKPKGGGAVHRTLNRGADQYSVPSGAEVPVSGAPRSFGVMPGAAAKSLRLIAASPSRSSPLTHDSNTHIGSQRVAWQVLVQDSASVGNAAQA